MRSLFTLFILFFGTALALYGQDCVPSVLSQGTYLHANNYRGLYTPSGNTFWDGSDAALHHETDAGDFATIFSQGLWLGGLDPGGNLAVSIATYGASSGRSDYYPGPLNEDGTTASDQCSNYDKVWTVTRWHIENHIADFADNSQIDNPMEEILGWPGRGNESFVDIAGFSLPDTPQGLAPFRDLNADGIYQPLQGEYPIVPQLGDQIAEQIVWSVFNTKGGPASESNSVLQLNVEVQLLGWALNCEDNELLNNTIFSSYRIINRGLEEIIDFRAGLWADFDLGCYTDDYVGSAPELNTYYTYNVDNVDGTVDSTCDQGIPSMGENPATQAITILNRPLSSFIPSNNNFVSPPDGTEGASTPVQYYNKLNGLWNDGTPVTTGGSGYNPDSDEVVSFCFPDDPNDPEGWSMFADILPVSDRRGVGATILPNLVPGAVTEIDVAYSYHREPGADHLENVTALFTGIGLLQSFYDDNFSGVCTQTVNCDNDCVWTGDLNADGIANHEDLLAYGFNQVGSGATRTGPYNWYPRAADSWGNSQLIAGTDLKHLDADGNGIIEEVDFEKTIQHYDLTRPNYEAIAEYPTGDDFAITKASGNQPLEGLTPGQSTLIRVTLLTEVDNLRGLAFSIDFDPTYISSIRPLTVSGESNLNHGELKNDHLDFAIYSIGEENTINDRIFTGMLGVSNDFSTPLPTDESFLCFRNIRAYLTDGTAVELGAQKVRVQIDGIPTSTQEPSWGHSVNIYPNPVQGILHLNTGNTIIERIQVLDSQGKLILTKTNSLKQLDTQRLPKGIYAIRLFSDSEFIVRKFVKM